MSDDKSILPNRSVSQIDFDESSHADLSGPFSENISNSEKFKSIGAYFIVRNDPACLLEAKKYLDKGSMVFIFMVAY